MTPFLKLLHYFIQYIKLDTCQEYLKYVVLDWMLVERRIFSPKGTVNILIIAALASTLFSCQINKKTLAPITSRSLKYTTINIKLEEDNNSAISTKTKIFRHGEKLGSAVFSGDGKAFLTTSGDRLALWDSDGRNIATYKHEGLLHQAVFSKDDQLILTVSADSTAKLWDRMGLAISTFKHDAKIRSADFSPSGKQILTAANDGTARLWKVSGQHVVSFKHNGPLNSAKFSPDGKYILTTAKDSSAKLWDKEGQIIAIFKHGYHVKSAEFSPDGKEILTTSFKHAFAIKISEVF